MKRFPLLVACVLLVSSSMAFAQVDRSKLPDGKASSVWHPPKVNVFSLANGVSVWHVEQRHTPLVTSMLVMPRGAALESAESAGGIALMVDLMDEGAGERDALEVSAEMQRLAMDFGASVNSDATTLSMNILAEKLDESFAVFTDILMKPKFQAVDFERRKAQRIASSIASEADLGRSAFRVTARRLFLDGYSGLPINGTKTTLENVTLDSVRAAYPQVITPVGSTLIVVGAVSSEQLKKTLEESGLAAWTVPSSANKQSLETRALKDAPNDLGQTIEVVDFPGSAQSFVIMARRAPGADAGDRYDAQVFNHSFAGSFTSRVNLNLREDKGYTYGARGGFSRSRLSGKYAVYAKVKRDTTRQSLDEMILELKGVSADRPVTEQERDNAVNGILKGFPGRFERGGALANQLAGLAAKGRPADDLSGYPNQIAAVSLAKARASAEAYTDHENFAIIIAGDWQKIKDSLTGLKRTVVFRNADGTLAPTTK